LAYLRKEKEALEISYSLDRVWAAVPKVLANFQWKVDELDNGQHHIKAKTQGGLLSWESVLLIDLEPLDKGKTKLMVVAETPVTTITSMVEFGRTRQRINMFLSALAEELGS
jgi:uncharacterized lipoprotein